MSTLKPIVNPRKLEHYMALGGFVLGSLMLYLKGMRTTIFEKFSLRPISIIAQWLWTMREWSC